MQESAIFLKLRWYLCRSTTRRPAVNGDVSTQRSCGALRDGHGTHPAVKGMADFSRENSMSDRCFPINRARYLALLPILVILALSPQAQSPNQLVEAKYEFVVDRNVM